MTAFTRIESSAYFVRGGKHEVESVGLDWRQGTKRTTSQRIGIRYQWSCLPPGATNLNSA